VEDLRVTTPPGSGPATQMPPRGKAPLVAGGVLVAMVVVGALVVLDAGDWCILTFSAMTLGEPAPSG
jgi:hypothetical protein